MSAPSTANAPLFPGGDGRPPRGRLLRDRGVLERFGLRVGAMYRVAYRAGGVHSRRVSRSLVVFDGLSERRRWDGELAPCLDFSLPHGRALSMLAGQVIDVRPAELNEGGQWVLLAQKRARPRRHPVRRPEL